MSALQTRPAQSNLKVLKRAIHTSSKSANLSRMVQPQMLHIYTLFWCYEFSRDRVHLTQCSSGLARELISLLIRICTFMTSWS